MSPTGKIRIERREHPRFQVRLDMSLVRVGHQKKPSSQGGQVEVRDISQGGVQVYTETKYEVGDQIVFEIEIPEESAGVRGTAEVKWIRDVVDLKVQGSLQFAMGLRFLDVRAEGQSFIARFVEKNLLETK